MTSGSLRFFSSLLLACLFVSSLSFSLLFSTESGSYSIYFMEEKVGYEEYRWESDERGYLLTVQGQITKPIQMRIETLTIHMNPSFIPDYYHFKGGISGIDQEIISEITEGRVEHVQRVSGEQQTFSVKINRDAFLLPNPIYSPYMAITKKLLCSPDPSRTYWAYLIPQMETPFTLENGEEDPCRLVLRMGAAEIFLETDQTGALKSLEIPAQKIKIIRD